MIAISVDPPEVSAGLRRTQGYTFTILSDPNAELLRAYDLLHAGAGPEGSDIARPAEFLVDAAGTIRWANITDSYTARLQPEQVLKVIDDLGLGLAL